MRDQCRVDLQRPGQPREEPEGLARNGLGYITAKTTAVILMNWGPGRFEIHGSAQDTCSLPVASFHHLGSLVC
jgi:hypothetical protein